MWCTLGSSLRMYSPPPLRYNFPLFLLFVTFNYGFALQLYCCELRCKPKVHCKKKKKETENIY